MIIMYLCIYKTITKMKSTQLLFHNCKKRRKKGINYAAIGLIYTTIFLLSSSSVLLFVDASRAYPLGCSHESPSYYDYDAYPLPPPDLPSRSHDDFSLLRRLGAGKFSDVFEAVDVSKNGVDIHTNNDQHPNDSEKDNNTTNQSKSLNNNPHQSIDPNSLCVIKCLKPVSERKIKRELLVLSHASKLPNLARLRAVVIPTNETTTTTRNNNNNNDSYSSYSTGQFVMPSLVLEHAGSNARWLCHGKGCDHTTPPSPYHHHHHHYSTTTTHDDSTTTIKEEKDDDDDEESLLYLSEYEIKYYLCHLLIALNALHSRGIMHRDVKPRNVLINRTTITFPSSSSSSMIQTPTTLSGNKSSFSQVLNTSSSSFRYRSISSSSSSTTTSDATFMNPPPLMLIDLGLADFYLPNQRYNVRVASRHYKAPELLLGYEFYDYGIDMWGVGCILAGLLLRREPFFRGKDNMDQLGKIVSILGSNDLIEYCDKWGIELNRDMKNVIRKYTVRMNPTGRRKSWLGILSSSTTTTKGNGGKSSSTTNRDTSYTPSRLGLNLLDQLLIYDHEKRLTANEALMHPFFDEVRELVKNEVKERWAKEQRSR